MNVLKNLAVAGDQDVSTLGYLTWNSVPDKLVSYATLVQLFTLNGLDTGVIPKEVKPTDAFARAASVKRKLKISEDKQINYFCREVRNGKDKIVRHIVAETVDARGERLSYEPQAAIVTFDKNTLLPNGTSFDDVSREMLESIFRDYDIFKDHFDGNVVRSIVRKVLYTCSPTPVRPSGGVYFIPAKYEERLRALNIVIGELEKGEGYAVPVIKTQENTDMIRKKLADNLQSVLHETRSAVEDAKSGAKAKGYLTPILEEARKVVASYSDYADILSGDLKTMESTVKGINQAVNDLFIEIANMSVKKKDH